MAECCVCLQAFDEDDHVPRVLPCGHTLCDQCVKQLLCQQELRCPECGHLSRFANVHLLPRNIELLRLINDRHPPQSVAPGRSRNSSGSAAGPDGRGFLVLQNLGLFPGPGFERCSFTDAAPCSPVLNYGHLCFYRGSGSTDEGSTDEERRYLVSLLELWGNNSRDRLEYRKSAYAGLALKIWQDLSRECKKELMLLSRINSVCTRVCRVLGFWLSEQGTLYLVNRVASQRDISSVDSNVQRDVGSSLCEALVELHNEGMICGIFGPQCFALDEFGRVSFHWNGAFDLRQTLHRSRCEVEQHNSSWQYTSPEMLQVLSTESSVKVSSASDTWSLACFLLELIYRTPARVLTFKQACEEAQKPECRQQSEHSQAHDSLEVLLRKCLVDEPELRGSIPDLWQLLAFPDCDPPWSLKQADVWCFGLEFKVPSEDAPTDSTETKTLPKIMKGHIGHISSLAIFGQLLVSASYDKTVRVWSLKDGVQVWMWEGHHSQRIMAGAADTSSQIFYTGDYGNTICGWKICEPFDTKPLVTWQEHNDWRFIGVSALAVTSNGFLYSGSGDRSIKLWDPKGCVHLSTLEGHQGVVSALTIDGELLYSGSWDGSIRLWNHSHDCLLVLQCGGDGAIRSLAVFSERNVLVSSHSDGSVQVWEGRRLLGRSKVHEETVCALANVGGLLVTGSWDKSIKAWHIDQLAHGNYKPVLEIKAESAVTSLIACDHQHLVAASTEIIQTFRL